MPVRLWGTDNQYDSVSMRETLYSLDVINNTAERGVKDIQEYANAARDKGRRGHTILVSNSQKVTLPEFTKNEMKCNI